MKRREAARWHAHMGVTSRRCCEGGLKVSCKTFAARYFKNTLVFYILFSAQATGGKEGQKYIEIL